LNSAEEQPMGSNRGSAVEVWLERLNPEQREAVEFFEGSLLVLAGAGSGKTRVLTTRIAHLVAHHGIPPDRILAVTFTNKAAGEMRERIAELLEGQPRGMWIGTFHAIGARLLRRHAPALGWERAFSIFDQDQSLRTLKKVQERLGVDPKRFNPKAVRSAISDAKNQLIDAATFARDNEGSFDFFARNVARVFPAYQQALADQNAMDFDDLLVKPVHLLETHEEILATYANRFQFVLVDEYQDTNRAQFRFLELMAGGHGNLMVVGDDDQSIYGWRGADIRNILDFEKTFSSAHVLRLEQNYRSTQKILTAANSVIEHNTERKGKTLRTDRVGGESIVRLQCVDEVDEARTIVESIEAQMLRRPLLDHSSFAVLYRTNAQSRAMEDAFRRRGVPYQVVGGTRFYERREIQDVLAYLRLISNPLDLAAFDRIVNVPRRGIGATSLGRMYAWSLDRGIPPLEAAERAGEVPDMPSSARRSLERFAAMVRRFSELAEGVQVGEVVQAVIEETGFIEYLRSEGPEGEDRIENVKELIAAALDFDADTEPGAGFDKDEAEGLTDLDQYLQRVALVADVDRLDPDADTVTLMTLHNAKGLEYPVVFIGGLEDGLFPLSRAYDDPAQLEEERRLFYVGVTRAMDLLFLCNARQRRRAGETMMGRLSPFVEHIPPELTEVRVTERIERESRALSQFVRRGADGYRRSRSESGPKPSGSGFEDTGEPYFDLGPDDAAVNQDLPRMIKGERVTHDTFGSGAVVAVSGFGPDIKVTVDFESVGRKKLLARYANLKKDYF